VVKSESYYTSDEYAVSLLLGAADGSAETEPNNSRTSADPLDARLSGNLSSSTDEDWFSFSVTSATSATLSFDSDKNSSLPYWSLTIQDINGVVLAGAGTGKDRSISTGITTPGTYYVVVKSESYYTSDEYAVAISLESTQEAPSHTLMASSSTGGFISGSGFDCGQICALTFSQSTVVAVRATAQTGYVFKSWTGCDTVVGDECSITLTANKSVAATFEAVQAASEDTDGSNESNASFNAASKTLILPIVSIDQFFSISYYSLELRLANNILDVDFELVTANEVSGADSIGLPSYNISTNTLTIPTLVVNDTSYYLEFILVPEKDPLTFRLNYSDEIID
jgi:hypothetical protein